MIFICAPSLSLPVISVTVQQKFKEKLNHKNTFKSTERKKNTFKNVCKGDNSAVFQTSVNFSQI